MGYLSLEDIYPDDVEKYGHLRVGMTDLYVKDNHAIYGVVTDLKVAIRQFITAHNEHSAKPFKWNKTAEAIISSVHKAKLSVIKNKLMN